MPFIVIREFRTQYIESCTQMGKYGKMFPMKINSFVSHFPRPITIILAIFQEVNGYLHSVRSVWYYKLKVRTLIAIRVAKSRDWLFNSSVPKIYTPIFTKLSVAKSTVKLVVQTYIHVQTVFIVVPFNKILHYQTSLFLGSKYHTEHILYITTKLQMHQIDFTENCGSSVVYHGFFFLWYAETANRNRMVKLTNLFSTYMYKTIKYFIVLVFHII